MVSEPSILATESMEDEIRFQILEEHIKNQDAKLTEFEDTVQKQFSEFQKQMSDLMSDLNASMNTKLEAWLNAITPGNKRTAWDNLKQSDVTLLEKSPAAEVEVEPMVSPMILDEFIEEKGYKLNSEGGILKVSPDGLLLQSSTVANSNSFEFADGVKESVPCSYNEFAERLVLPQYKNHPEKGNAYMRNEKFDIHNCADNKFGYDEHGNLQGDLIVFEKTEINGILCHNWIDDRNFTGAVFNDDEDFVEVLDDFPKLKLEQNIEKLEVIGIRMKSNKKLGNSWVENATGFKGGTIFARKYWVLYQCNGTFCDSYNFSRVVTSSRFTAKLIGSWHFHISWNPWLLVESDVARMTFLIPILHKLLFKHKVELNLLWETVFNTGLAPLSRNVYGILSRSYNFRKFFSCGTHFTLYSKTREGVLGNESVYILVALIRLVQDETEMLLYGCVEIPELKLVGEKAKDAFVFEQSEATVELSLLVSADLQTKAPGLEQPAAACDKRMNIQLIQDEGSVTLGGLVKTPTLQLIRGKAKEPFFMAVSKWRYYLRGHHFRVRTDHQYVKSLLLQGCVENPELKLGKGKAKSTAFQAEIPTEQDVTLGRRIVMAFQVLGFVFSDVRTSPLYTFSVMFSKDPVKGNEDVLGALSLVLYTLILIPLIKHVLIVLWANDHGESGTFALYSLICRHTKVSLLPNQLPSDARISSSRLKVPSAELERSLRLKKRLETSLTMKKAYPDVSSCWYFYGDSRWCVTSAMSVLFCLKVGVSGIKQDQVLMISIAFLVILFSVQRYETSKVGIVVGSALLIWFCSLGCIGIYNLVKYDTRALKAFNPVHIYYFFRRNSTKAWYSLGGCLLCVTGSEAMFADLCYFSVRSVQLTFMFVVLPCLLLGYLGQAAYLMDNHQDTTQAFFSSVPSGAFWPVFLIANIAALIASRTMTTATFSCIKQSTVLGCFPRLKIVHTSRKFMGQIYIPVMNWFLLAASLVLVCTISNMYEIGNAYGIAELGVMMMTTILVTLVMLLIWQINIIIVLSFAVIFLGMELTFFSSVLWGVGDGSWIILVFAIVMFLIMYIWNYGSKLKYETEVRKKMSMDLLRELGPNLGTVRAPGIGLVYNELAKGIPAIFGHFLTTLPAVHSMIIFVCIKYVPVPVVPQSERFLFRRVCPKSYHIFRCVARYGYKDVRKENHQTFEQLLIESLEKFIRREAQERSLESDGDDDSDSEEEHSFSRVLIAPNGSVYSLGVPLLTEFRDASKSIITEASTSEEVTAESGSSSSDAEQSLEKELSFIRRAKESGVVYLLGHGDIRARKDSWFIKKLVINYFYAFLRKNCRRGIANLSVPQSHLMQVGMTYMV